MSGVKITRAPADLKTLSALAENFLSRSWMTAFELIPSSSSVQARLRVAEPSTPHLGWPLQAASKTRLVARCT